MERRRIEQAVCACAQEASSGVYCWKLAEEAKPKQLSQAIETYASDVKPEEIVALMDTSLGRNGKNGFLLTEMRLYGKSLKQPYLELDALESICEIPGKPDQLIFRYRDGSVYESGILERNVLKIAYSLLRILIGTGAAERPQGEEYEEFHRLYGAELRRRLTALLDEINIPNLRLTNAVDASRLETALESFAAGVTREEVVAFEDLYLTKGKKGVLLTERALYYTMPGSSWLCTFDGLTAITRGRESGERFLLYKNGYTDWVMMYTKTPYEALIEGAIRIYREIWQEAKEKGGHTLGLSSIAGWEEFLERRRQGDLDVCRNSVFVSSTFKDMHFERDIIHEQVLPRLNQAGEAYGQTVSFCDLRWGVNTGELDSDEGSKKVLSVCLSEIERCRPYMVVILGERYGWIPEASIIENALEGRLDFVLDDLEKSVTALEIEFGALTEETQLDRTFFYFREFEGEISDIYRGEDELHAKKLAELKKRIEKLAKGRIRTYRLSWENGSPRGLENFAELVTGDLLASMKEEWEIQAQKGEWEREREAHWELAEKKALQCSGRDDFILSLLNTMNRGETRIALTGTPGSGKSTVMGCLAQVLRLSGVETLPIFCAHTALCDTASEIAEAIARFLEERLPLAETSGETEQETPSYWVERMRSAVLRYEKEGEKQVALVVDAVDQLAPDELRNNLKFLPESRNGKICVIFSCVEELELPYVPCKISLPSLKKEDCPAVIEGILRLHHRELERPVILAAAEKKAADHPLYLSILIQRLLLMNKNDFDEIAGQGDGMSAISRHQMELIEGADDTLPGISRELLDAAGERLGGGFVGEAMKYLALSRRGLRESDLEGLLGQQGISWSGLDFSLFIHYLRNMYTFREDGRYDFSHKSFRQGLLEQMDAKEQREYQGRIARWLYGLPVSDQVRTGELFFHGLEAEDTELLAAFLEEGERTEREREILARELAAQSRRDKGELLCRLIAGKEKEGFTGAFLRFLTHDWHFELTISREDSLLEERVMQALLPGAKALAKQSGNPEEKRFVGVIYSRLGVIYRNMEETEKALSYMEEALAQSEALEREIPGPEQKQDVAIDLRQLGQTLEKLGGPERMKQAEDCYLRSIETAEEAERELKPEKNKRCAGWGYRRLAELYDQEKRTKEAAAAYERCVEAWRDPGTEGQKKNLGKVYREIGDFYYFQEDPQECRKALGYFEKAESIWEELVRDNPSVDNLDNQALNWLDMGRSCRFDMGEEFWERGIDCYEKGRQVLKNTDPVYYRASIARADVRMGNMLWEKHQGDVPPSVQLRCEELAREAVEIFEELAREKDTVADYEELTRALHYYISWSKNPQVVTRIRERRIEIWELLYDRTHDGEYKKRIKEERRTLKLYRVLS